MLRDGVARLSLGDLLPVTQAVADVELDKILDASVAEYAAYRSA